MPKRIAVPGEKFNAELIDNFGTTGKDLNWLRYSSRGCGKGASDLID